MAGLEQLSLDQAIARQAVAFDRLTDAHADWIAYAREFVYDYLTTHPLLFCDWLWEAGLVPPVEARALGPVLQYAIRQGWMEATDEWMPSVHSNGSAKKVYRSVLAAGDEATGGREGQG